MRRGGGWTAFVVAIALAAGAAAAQETAPPAPGTPSADQRHAMAEIHQKMADCLDSERPINECRADMLTNCRTMMGPESCPKMMGLGHGMMGGRMGTGMMPSAPKPPDASN